MLQNKENYNFNGVGDEIAKAYNEGYKQGVKAFADFIKSQMGIEREYVFGLKYRQGVFSDYEIDDLVEYFNNLKEN